MRRESRGEQRRQRGDRAIHQTGETRLQGLKQEQSLRLRLLIRAQLGFRDLFGRVRVAAFLFGELAEKLTNPWVTRSPRRCFVEALGLELHACGSALHCFKAERTHKPDWTSVDETTNVLPADQWHMIAEAAAI